MMKHFFAALALAIGSVPTAHAETTAAAQPEAVESNREPVTILVSIDGFHPDYIERGLTPTLSQLAQEGVFAPMQPSFPSKTFPNHWTLVTGLVPDHHGITANRMQDPERPDETFTMSNVDPFWWSDAKPVWVAAEEAGIRTAAMFWPGSAVPWGGTARRFGPVDDGVLPSDWQAFSMQVSNTQRVNSVLDWLRRPSDIRPRFVTLYFDTVDTAGHDGGPDGEKIQGALQDIDQHIAELLEGLEQLAQPTNLVIVSDHGMAATSSSRVIAMDELLTPGTYEMFESGAYATFVANLGSEAAFEAELLTAHSNMDCWRKEDIPARFAYGTHRRVPPYLCLAKPGWIISSSRSDANWSGGTHGYDPAAPEMAAIFIGYGPAFAAGATLPKFANTNIAPLLRELIGLSQSSELDGSLDVLRPALQE